MNQTGFKEVLSDILLGMAAGLKRDPIVILRIDGEDLLEFTESPRFEAEAIAIFSEIKSADGSLQHYLTKALEQLTVDHGMPPPSHPWVLSNIVEPALQSCIRNEEEQPISQEIFLQEFNNILKNISEHLKEQPVIVAHSENTFDGSGIKRLLSNNFEFEKLVDTTWKEMTKDRNEKVPKAYLRVALDGLATAAGLPPFGAVDQVDKVVNEVIKMVNADDDGNKVHEDEFKKIMKEILGSIMLQMEANPISVSSSSVVQEPLSPSSLLTPTISEQVD